MYSPSLWTGVEATGALPMLTGLCGGHVGVVWWVLFGRTARIHALVHTFVHTVYACLWVSVGVNYRCEKLRCRAQPMKATTTHKSSMRLVTMETTWDHMATQFTALFTVLC